MSKIIPGILTDNEEDYREKLEVAEHTADLIQVDVVDGLFAKSKTIGIDVIRDNPSSSQLEIQLMVVSPKKYIEKLVDLDFVSRIIFPLETTGDVFDLIYLVKRGKKNVGISLNVETDVSEVLPYADDINLLLLLTGKPGYSGQKLGKNTYERIRQAKHLMPSLGLEIDIGVNFENAAKLARSGADFLVTSSTLFEASDFHVAFNRLAAIAKVKDNKNT